MLSAALQPVSDLLICSRQPNADKVMNKAVPNCSKAKDYSPKEGKRKTGKCAH